MVWFIYAKRHIYFFIEYPPPPTPPLPVSPTPTSAENSENWIQNLAIVFADKGKNDTLPS